MFVLLSLCLPPPGKKISLRSDHSIAIPAGACKYPPKHHLMIVLLDHYPWKATLVFPGKLKTDFRNRKGSAWPHLSTGDTELLPKQTAYGGVPCVPLQGSTNEDPAPQAVLIEASLVPVDQKHPLFAQTPFSQSGHSIHGDAVWRS